MERRGSRARRRQLSGIMVDMSLLTAAGSDQNGEEELPVVNTTSVEVERKPDGSVAKVNEYVVIRDLGQGSSAEVKLCRLVPALRSNGAEEGNDDDFYGDDGGGGCSGRRSGCQGGHARGHDGCSAAAAAVDASNDDNHSDLYAVKIFDRAGLMRRGSRFARPRRRGPNGAILPEGEIAENFVKVQREIAIMKKLVHPNIVLLVEVIDAPLDSSLYMVMEYAERGAVMICVEPERGRYACPRTGGCLDALTAARYFADILTGLECLHLHLIAHRDLKPENVLIGDDGRAKIADFGVSQYFTDDERKAPMSPSSLARSTSRAQMSNTEGTWCFWSPEMCGTAGDGAAFNAYAVDAWAAGVTLWCLLFGHVPYFSSSPMDLFKAIAKDPAPIPDGVDTSLRDLLELMLDKDPGKRLTVPEARAHHWTQSSLAAAVALTATAAAAAADRHGIDRGHTKISITDEDIKGAVTEAPGFVLVTKLKETMQGVKARARRLSRELGVTSLSQAAKSVAAATLGELGGASTKDPMEKTFDEDDNNNDHGNNHDDDDDDDDDWAVYEEEVGTEEKPLRHTRRRTPSMVCVAS